MSNPTNIFVNMAVKDLKKSIEFFKKVGYTFNPKFTDDTATCMIISDTIYAMLMTEEKFKSFSPTKEICDTSKSNEVYLALSLGSRDEVVDVTKKAVSAGGKQMDEEDHGFMYSIAIQDLDGHIWNYFYMDLQAFDKCQQQQLECAK